MVIVCLGESHRAQCAPTASRLRTSSVAQDRLALCLHGFPDSAHTWRHLLPEPRRRRLPRRCSLSTGLRTERGSEGRPIPDRRPGARRDRVARGARRRRRRRHHRPRLGWPGHVRCGEPRARAVVEGRRAGGPAQRCGRTGVRDQSRTAASDPGTCSSSSTRWPISSCRPNDLAFIDRLWRDWSPGFDATEELALVKPSLRDPANLQAALGYYRATLGAGYVDPALADVQAATQAVPTQPTLYLHGADDGAIGVEVAEAARPMVGENVSIEIVAGTGHFLHLEQPEIVNRRIVEFLTVTDHGLMTTAPPRLPDGLVAVVKRECATCVLVVPVLQQLAGGATNVTVYTQDDPDFPSGMAARHDGDLAISWHHGVETVPTLIRVDGGVEVDRTVGWHREQWERVTGMTGLGPDLPPMRPGCGSLSRRPRSHRRAARAVQRIEAACPPHRDRRARGRDGGAVRPGLDRRPAGGPADRGAGVAHARGHESRAPGDRRRRAAGPRRDHGGEDRDQCRHGGVQARAPAVGHRRRRGRVHRRVQRPRGARHHDAGRAGRHLQRSGDPVDRDERRRERARAGQPRQPDDRPGVAARRAQRRRRPSGRGRPRRPRQPRQAQLLLPRGRARLALDIARRLARRARLVTTR